MTGEQSGSAPGIDWIKMNWAALTDLPHPSETWTIENEAVRALTKRNSLTKLHCEGIIIETDKSAENDYRRVWRTHPHSYAEIQKRARNYDGATMPNCEHPFHINHAADGFACKHCGASANRDEMMQATA